jgi:hypothetical protein
MMVKLLRQLRAFSQVLRKHSLKQVSQKPAKAVGPSLNQLLYALDKCLYRDRAFGFFLAADADVDFVGFHFAVA